MFLHFNSHLRQEGTQMESKTQDRHRKVECDVCSKPMRSDHLKRHKKNSQRSAITPRQRDQRGTKKSTRNQEKARRKDTKSC